MKMAASKYAEGLMSTDSPRLPVPATTRERLVGQREHHTEQIAEIDKAIALLDRNSDTEELLNLLGRINY